MLPRKEGGFSASGVFMPSRGQYRMRMDVYLSDPVPANVIFTIQAQ